MLFPYNLAKRLPSIFRLIRISFLEGSGVRAVESGSDFSDPHGSNLVSASDAQGCVVTF